MYPATRSTFNSTLATFDFVVAGASALILALAERFHTPEFPVLTTLKPSGNTRRSQKILTIRKVQSKVKGCTDFPIPTEERCSRKTDFANNSRAFRSSETLLFKLFNEESLFFVF